MNECARAEEEEEDDYASLCAERRGLGVAHSSGIIKRVFISTLQLFLSFFSERRALGNLWGMSDVTRAVYILFAILCVHITFRRNPPGMNFSFVILPHAVFF